MVFAGSKLFVRRSLPLLGSAPLLAALSACPVRILAQQTRPAQNQTSSTQAQAAPAQPVPTAAEQQQAQEHAQQVQALITRAQASYSSGVNNYNTNRLDAARTDFDAAVDIMLSSGMDLKNDAQLSDAFEHLLDSINSLEIVALKQGNGFSPKVEEAPLEEAESEVTFAPDPALLGRIAAQVKTTKSDLPLTVNEYVAGFISYFSNSQAGHAHLVRSLERAGKYQAMIAKDLSDAGLPQDLIYLAVAESGFQPQVVNRGSGAGGMWQFMPFQGAYGLERNGYFDERFDPEKSSLAYARYMKYLYAQFGDWYLAMAAYNWGPGNVQRAVQRTGYADFWELYRRNVLPTATKNYVPGIIAAAIMAKNPQQYGLANLVPDAPVVSDTVTVDYPIDLKLVADLTNATVPEIVALNPALLRLITPRDIPYDLHLPPGTRETFATRLKDIPEEDRATWRFHVVKQGETLDDIATSFHTRQESLATYNEVTPATPIAVGDELVIPISGGTARALGQLRYTTHRGDSFVTIADRFGVTVEQLHEWNPSLGDRLAAGHSMYVAEPVHLAPAGRGRGRGRSAVSTHGVSSAHSARAISGSRSAGAATRRSSSSAGTASTKRHHR